MLAVLLVTLVIALQMGLYFALIQLSHRTGRAALYATLGLLEGMKFFMSSGAALVLPFEREFNFASVVMFPCTVALAMVLFLRQGAPAVREFMWALVLAIACSIVLSLASAQVVEAGLAVDIRQSLRSTAYRMFVGTALVLVDVAIALTLMRQLLQLRLPLTLAIGLALCVVMAFDTLIYELAVGDLAHAPQVILGKCVASAVIAICIYVYLKLLGQTQSAQRMMAREQVSIFKTLSLSYSYDELTYLAMHDALTDCLNRRAFEDWLADAIHQPQVIVLLMDIDHFKRVNDTHGHLAGDAALKFFVAAVQSLLSEQDKLYRYGGEEFAVGSTTLTLESAATLAQRIQTHLSSNPFVHGNHQITLSVTMSLAQTPQDGRNRDELLRRADRRLYAGKRAGRGRLVTAD
jgi:diguanylate cyclase (GGDEF)-like protein